MMLHRVAKVFTSTKTFLVGAFTLVITVILISKICLHLAPERPRLPRVVVDPAVDRVHRQVGANLRRIPHLESRAKGAHPLRTQTVELRSEGANPRRTRLDELHGDGENQKRTQPVEPHAEKANPQRTQDKELHSEASAPIAGGDFSSKIPLSSQWTQRLPLEWQHLLLGQKLKHLTSDRGLGENEPLMRRVKRSLDDEILFSDENPVNRNPKSAKHPDYKDECFYAVDGVCFGYYQTTHVSQTWATIPSADFMQGCSFTRNFRWTVPEMLKRNGYLRDSATGSKTYLRFLEETRRDGDFRCTVEFDKCPVGCTYKWKYGRECERNHFIGDIAYKIHKNDFPNNSRIKPPEAGQLTQLIKDACPYYTSTGKEYRFPTWKNDAINAYVTVLYYYSRCAKPINPKSDPSRFCPNPCNDDFACSKPNMQGNCAPVVREDNKYQAMIDPDHFGYLKPIFNKVAYCYCLAGYEYNLETEECELQVKICQDKEFDCLNNGLCSPVPDHVREIIGRDYNCQCKPAWQGLRCEQARNPCRIPENLWTCGEFECRRSPKDEVNGYSCICTEGYTLTRQTGKPSCADVNECATSKPCRNGGQCKNLIGSFSCDCRLGFSGRLCEIPPPEPYWLAWESWSICSVTCSVGVQIRWRHCSITGSCMGMRKDTKNCMGRRLECSGLQADSDPMLLSGGAGWREEEDAILDDAWYFREFQLLKMGRNNRTTPEELLLMGLEDIVYFNLPIYIVVGIIEILIFISICRQHRMRRLARLGAAARATAGAGAAAGARATAGAGAAAGASATAGAGSTAGARATASAEGKTRDKAN